MRHVVFPEGDQCEGRAPRCLDLAQLGARSRFFTYLTLWCAQAVVGAQIGAYRHQSLSSHKKCARTKQNEQINENSFATDRHSGRHQPYRRNKNARKWKIVVGKWLCASSLLEAISRKASCQFAFSSCTDGASVMNGLLVILTMSEPPVSGCCCVHCCIATDVSAVLRREHASFRKELQRSLQARIAKVH